MSITGYLEGAAAWYRDGKRDIEVWTGASQELLHVHAGLLIFVGAALVLRKKFRSPVPLALVFVLAVVNELVDLINGPSARPSEPYWDVANTVFWPCVLFMLALRWR